MTEENGKPFSAFFTAEDVICRLKASTREEAIRELLTLLAMNHGIGNVHDVYTQIMAQERMQPSLIADYVAMPHARLAHLETIRIAVATAPGGIAYPGAEDRPVRLIILVLAPRDDPALYLKAISSLAKICRAPEAVETLAGLTTPQDVWHFFGSGGVVLPDFIRAADIMQADPVTLRETDTLAQAIDYFVQHNLIDVPVVDADGDLVGVVTVYELLRVCLPDYILWMDDVSPILQFEPFAEVLRNESTTWMAEIMLHDYVGVTEGTPAIQVAKEITREGARQAYVLRGKRLVGVITLQHFLKKVLRE